MSDKALFTQYFKNLRAVARQGDARVCINATQCFVPVPKAVWSYQIGGYQVCEKWLKDRRERRLELDDIRAYCRIVTALAGTIEIQQRIDALYPAAESRTVVVEEQTQGGAIQP